MTDSAVRIPADHQRRFAARDGHSQEQLAPDEEYLRWSERGRVVLTPIAAPSIMGLTGFMLATLMVGAWQAGWYGTSGTPALLWPFALVAGGLLQSAAAIMSFRARDGVAVAVHTAWGAFWVGWGLLQLLVTTNVVTSIPIGVASPALAFWFIGLTLVTLTCVFATIGRHLLQAATLAALTGGAAITAAGFYAGSTATLRVGGWFFVVSAGLAWLVVTAMVLEHSYGRTIIPLGTTSKRGNIPGRRPTIPIEYAEGMPGARVGQ